MCSTGRGKGNINCKLTPSLRKVLFVPQSKDPRACRTVITCWGSGKVSVWKIMPALLTNYVDAAHCYNLELFFLNYWALSLSIAVLISVHSVFFVLILPFQSCTQTVVILWTWYNSYNAVKYIVRTEPGCNSVISTTILQMHVRWLKFLIYFF